MQRRSRHDLLRRLDISFALSLCCCFHLLRHPGVGVNIRFHRNDQRLRLRLCVGRLVRQQVGKLLGIEVRSLLHRDRQLLGLGFCLQSVDLLLKTGFATLVDFQILLLHLLALLREVHIREAAHHSRQERFVRTSILRSCRAEVVYEERADQRRLLLGRNTSRRSELLPVSHASALLGPETALTEFRVAHYALHHGVVKHLLLLFLQRLVRNLHIEEDPFHIGCDMLVADFPVAAILLHQPFKRRRRDDGDEDFMLIDLPLVYRHFPLLVLDLFVADFNIEVADDGIFALLMILNDKTVAEDDKKEYLNGQQNRIQDIDKVMDEAKETAIELFLTTPTWENVAAYFTFSGQGVSDSLKLYIEYYDTELGRTICPDTISVKEQLFDVYIASCVLEIDSFKKILHSFDNTIVDSESIPDLNSQRLGILIDAGKVQYTEENISAISSSFNAEDMTKYLEHHKLEYLQDIENIEYTTELALCLLRSTMFSLYDKAQIIPILDIEIIEASSALATEICTILTKTRIDLDENILTTVIGMSDNVSDRVIVATHTIKNDPDNSELVETLLRRLPSPYNEITEHDRKRPAFEKTDYNIELFATLSSIGYISSYSETENGLKVNKKVSSF